MANNEKLPKRFATVYKTQHKKINTKQHEPEQ